MTTCQKTHYARALRGMRRLSVEMIGRKRLPDWAEAGMRQHAQFYAREACKRSR